MVGQNRLNQAVGELVRDICGMEKGTIPLIRFRIVSPVRP